MTRLAELKELLSAARLRKAALHLQVSYIADTRVFDRAWGALTPGPPTVFVLNEDGPPPHTSLPGDEDDDGRDDPPEQSGPDYRTERTYWVESSMRWRCERSDNEEGVSVVVVDVDRWWRHDVERDVVDRGTMEDPYAPADPLLFGLMDPSWLLSSADLVVEGRDVVAARGAIRFRATRRRGVEESRDPFPPGDIAVLHADIELGILLKAEYFFEDALSERIEVMECKVLSNISPALFSPPSPLRPTT